MSYNGKTKARSLSLIEFISRKLVNWLNLPREPLHIISLALFTLFIMNMVAFIHATSTVWALEVNGRVVALARDEHEARSALRQLISKNSSNMGAKAAVAGEINMVRVGKGSGQTLDQEQIIENLQSAVTFNTKATAVQIDGKNVAVLRERSEAEMLLQTLKDIYGKNEQDISFEENITLVSLQVNSGQVLTVEQALEKIRQGSEAVQKYTVQEGDTLWDIAMVSEIPVQDIVVANPGMDIDHLKLGQQINLNGHRPLINVIAVSNYTELEDIAPGLQEKSDTNMLLGDRRILKEGKPGQREVTFQVVKRNGIEIERNVQQEKVLAEPEPRVVLKGAKTLLASRSSGGSRLSRPVAGAVVSPYGKRRGGSHTGMDIGSRSGTPVASAESGTVIYAGWKGGYGKCIEVSHGEGVITRYAHLSAINTSKGQKVSRGQLIGRVGSTGNSTGPHLHFEVMVNDSFKNPSQYL